VCAYSQNSTSEMNQTTEGFLSSILNDEDLQLMDMAMNEGEFHVHFCCSWLLIYRFVVCKILVCILRKVSRWAISLVAFLYGNNACVPPHHTFWHLSHSSLPSIK
jgi:hypothetical protein